DAHGHPGQQAAHDPEGQGDPEEPGAHERAVEPGAGLGGRHDEQRDRHDREGDGDAGHGDGQAHGHAERHRPGRRRRLRRRIGRPVRLGPQRLAPTGGAHVRIVPLPRDRSGATRWVRSAPVPSLRPSPGWLRTAAAGVAAAPVATAAACGPDEPDAADERAEQVREVAIDAGLPADAAEVLAVAARGVSATFQISYPGPDGTSLVVAQEPPNRRIDALEAGLVVESQVLVAGVAYRSELPDGGRPGDAPRSPRPTPTRPGT